MMKPVLEEVSTKLEGVIKVGKIDVDKSPKVSSEYEVKALPTLILFNKGAVVDR